MGMVITPYTSNPPFVGLVNYNFKNNLKKSVSEYLKKN